MIRCVVMMTPSASGWGGTVRPYCRCLLLPTMPAKRGSLGSAGSRWCVTAAKGLAVGFTTAAALVNELHEARDEKRLLRLQRPLASYKLLIVDELGYVPLSPTGADLFLDIFSQRYERASTIVT